MATLLKNLVNRAGLDLKNFAGHSLRSGLATAAAVGGASERAILDQTRHKIFQTRPALHPARIPLS